MRFTTGWVLVVALMVTACSSATVPTTSTAVATTAVTFSSSTWSRVPHDAAVFGGEGLQWMESVTVGGPGLVAVGWEGGDNQDAAVWTSPDGISWSRVPHDEAVLGGRGFQGMVSVTAGGPGLVAVGWEGSAGDVDAAIWTSPDGISWSRVPHHEAVFGGGGLRWVSDVTVGGPGLVAVGWEGRDDQDAVVWTSPDGISWSRVPHDEAVLGGRGVQGMSAVTVGGPGLVAVGWEGPSGDPDAAVWTSPDGISWSRVPHHEAVFGGRGSQGMGSVTVGGPGLVAVGSDELDAAVWTSPDGISWSRLPHDETVLGGGRLQWMSDVTVRDAGLVAVGWDASSGVSDAAVWTSPHGISWSRVPHDAAVFGGRGDQWMSDVTVGGPGLVVVGSDDSGDDQDAAVWATGA
jgi:hypothetical protein